MADTMNTAPRIPLVPDFVIGGTRGALIAESREQSERVRAMGRAFADLFRGIGHLFHRLDDAIAEARSMRRLVELNDRTLADIGIARSDIPAIIARGRLADGIDAAVEGFIASKGPDGSRIA